MTTDTDFENILNKPESSILDFKRTNYNLTNDADLDGTSKFVKDIISFANTIKTESAFIILGVDAKPDNTKELVGINEHIDEAILQDKIKDKAFPRPVFKYYSIKFKDLTFGIIEIPIQKYAIPISPTVKLRGLDVGKIYFRRGSSNTEALGIETININDWLKSLPEFTKNDDRSADISLIMRRATQQTENISSILTDALRVARKFSIESLALFCSQELKGISTEEINANPDEYKYRMQKILISVTKIEHVQSFFSASSSQIKAHLSNDSDFHDYTMLFPQSITWIESYLNGFTGNSKVATVTMKSSNIFQGQKTNDYDVYCYLFQDTFQNLNQSIRQKLIDILING